MPTPRRTHLPCQCYFIVMCVMSMPSQCLVGAMPRHCHIMCGVNANVSVNAMSLQNPCDVCQLSATSMPCQLNVRATSVPRQCHVSAMSRPSQCHVHAMSVRRQCDVSATSMPLPRWCHVNAMSLPRQYHSHVGATSVPRNAMSEPSAMMFAN